MTSLFHARRSAEEFAAAVDGERSSAQRASGTASLLEVVETLRTQDPVSPRDEFARELRERLLLEAETALSPGAAKLALPVRQHRARERRLAAAAAAFVVIGGTTTMAAASQDALPGDALYPVKRGIERAEAGLSLSSTGKGHDLLGQASARLGEVESMVASDGGRREARVSETLDAFTASAGDGSALMFEAYREDGDSAAVVEVRRFAAESIATLTALVEDVPSGARPDLATAAGALRDIDAEAAALCSSCAGDLPAVEVPTVLLVHAEADRALSRAAGGPLGNDHPVEVDRSMVEQAAKAARDAASAPQAPAATPAPGATAAPPGAQGPAAPEGAPVLPTPNLDPRTWPTLLPGLEQSTTSPTPEPGLVGSIVEDLTEAVETLLPDPTGTLID